MGRRVLVVGFDGATFDVILPMLEQGRLPAFSRVMAEGAWGPLKSTIPAHSAPAWTTFLTGVNPGKHGIYDFTLARAGSYDRRIMNTADIRAARIWDVLSAHGRRSVIMNVPPVYPAEAIHGVMVTGMLTPRQGGYVFPPEKAAEIDRVAGGYAVDLDYRRIKTDDEFLAALRRVTEGRLAAAQYLLAHEPWELFVVIFTSSDRLQHRLWHQRAIIEQYYEYLDSILATFMERLDEDTLLCVLSDHGFRAIEKSFSANRWLEAEGFLKRSPEGKDGSGGFGLWEDGASTGRDLRRLVDLAHMKRKLQIPEVKVRIDWESTAAFYPSAYAQGIRVNLRGREPQGTISPGSQYDDLLKRLEARLLAIRDPDTGRNIVSAIYRREEVYQGPYVGEAPDLVFLTQDGAYEATMEFGEEVLLTKKSGQGMHARDGILMLFGSSVRAGMIHGASICDIPVTVLSCLGLPQPEGVDGRLLQEAFYPVLQWVGPWKGEALPAVSSRGEEDQESEVRRRLEGLGYL